VLKRGIGVAAQAGLGQQLLTEFQQVLDVRCLGFSYFGDKVSGNRCRHS
jgi:hypothetical protein